MIAAAVFLTGCGAIIGPEKLEHERQDFNVALQQTNDEQMLLNLVRMKYRDTTMFLEVSAIASQYALTGSISGSGSLTDNFSNSIGLGSRIEYQEKPTISYTPLHGQKFITRLLSQVDPHTLNLLFKSGWSVERLFALCIEDLNGLKNTPSASGPTPEYVPEYKEFQKLIASLRELQKHGGVAFDVVKTGEEVALAFRFTERADSDVKKEIQQALKMGDKDVYLFTTNRMDKDNISFETRSIREMLFFLSQAVEVPSCHKNSGKVTITKDENGREFDWNEVSGQLMKVKSTANPIPPINAYVSVRYRNHWFYIEDNDLNSKSTFSLLVQLYDLQSGDSKGSAPLLTLPIGG